MSWKTTCLGFLMFASAAVLAADDASLTYLKTLKWTSQYANTSLDLSNYTLTFSDEFDAYHITPDNGAGPWYAPVHADFGSAKFDQPVQSGPTYTVANGVLSIRATKEADGWHSGNIETVNTKGQGFAQQYGYFEARMKMPAMPGAWPGFWLKSQEEQTNRSITRPEIDMVEWYGGDPRGLHSTVHLWPAPPALAPVGALASHWWLSNYKGYDGLANEWHTYGVLITPQFVIMYLDRKEITRFPTLDEYKLHLYPLITLTLYASDVAKATSPFELQVDYVRVFAPKIPEAPGNVTVN